MKKILISILLISITFLSGCDSFNITTNTNIENTTSIQTTITTSDNITSVEDTYILTTTEQTTTEAPTSIMTTTEIQTTELPNTTYITTETPTTSIETFELIGDSVFYVEHNSEFIDPGTSISYATVTGDAVDSSVLGAEYEIIYSVRNHEDLIRKVIICSPFDDFNFWSQEQRIMGYYGSAEKVVIPGKINGTEVLSITPGGFKMNGSTIKDVIVYGNIDINRDSFLFQNLNSLTISEENTMYKVEGNALLSKDGRIFCGLIGTHTDFVIPEGIEEIREFAFLGHKLEGVQFPNSLKVIGEGAFIYNNLVDIELKEGILEIKKNAFSQNKLTGELIIPDSVVDLGEGAFVLNNIESLKLSNGLTEIKIDTFKGNKLIEVTFPEGIVSIGEWAFAGNDLVSVNFPSTLLYIKRRAFQSNRLTSIVIPDNILTIEEHAFTTQYYFEYLLKEVYIGSGVTSLSNWAFDYQTLETVNISESNSNYKMIDNVLVTHDGLRAIATINTKEFNEGSTEGVVTIPEGIEVIDFSPCLTDCNFITSLSLPTTLKEIISGSILYGNLTHFSLESANPYLKYQNDLLMSSDGTILYGVIILGPSTHVDVPDGVIEISDYAAYLNIIDSITLPQSLKTIGYKSFYRTRINSLDLPSKLETIGDYAFQYNLIDELIIPDSVTSIGVRAFASNSIQYLTIGNGLSTIEIGVFEYNQIDSLIIPENITDIKMQAFKYNGTTSLTLEEGIKYIGSGAFLYNNLTEVTIPNSLESIGYRTFSPDPSSGNSYVKAIVPEGRTYHYYEDGFSWDYNSMGLYVE